MNSQEIEAFLAIIDKENFTEAAKALFISQSTLSHRLLNLEHELGFRLIERQKGCKSILLTDGGRDFLMTAKNWQLLMQDIERIKSASGSNLKLSIGAVDTFHAYIFPPLYRLLAAYEPKITLDLRTYNSAELYQQVDQGKLDVAFTLLNLPVKNVQVKQVYREPRVVLRRESSPKLSVGRIELADLDLDKEIFFIGDVNFNNWYGAWKAKYGYPVVQVDTLQLLSTFMQQEDNWTIVPLCIARAWVERGGYAWYYIKDQTPERICYRIQPQYMARAATEAIAVFDKCLAQVSEQIFRE